MLFLLDADDILKGPMSPSKGPDISLFSSFLTFLAFNVTNNGILLSQPCQLFLMTYFVIKGHLDDIKRGRCLSFSNNTTCSLVRDTLLALVLVTLVFWS
jgi:hypothetical protein